MTQPIRSEPNTLLPDTLDPPMLRGLTEVEFIRDILCPERPQPDPNQQLTGFDARILKKHLRKVIIEYDLRFGDSTRSYVGLYRDADERLGHTFSILKILRATGFGAESSLRVPGPIEYMPALNFLLIERAEGELLREALEREENSIPYIKGAARWLAKLHASEVKLDKISQPDDEIAASLRYIRAASSLFPRLEDRIQTLGSQLVNAQKELKPRPRTIIHGDYHPRNIIVSPKSTTVIDLEEAGMGDPALDVGYFIAQTKMTHGIEERIIHATEIFYQEYRTKQDTPQRDFAERVALFEAQTYLQRIYHTYYLLRMKPDFDLIAKWFDQSESCLHDARDRYNTTGMRKND